MESVKRVAILGATGSIGRSALEVLAEHETTHRVCGIACLRNHELLVRQAHEFGPEAVAIIDPAAGERAGRALEGTGIPVLSGEDALCELIDRLDPDIVLVAVSGAKGLFPSLKAASMGKRIALANKESLVMAGHLLLKAADDSGAEIIPVDSEHSAIFQALNGERRESVNRILLTASGGPFVDRSAQALRDVTPEAALKHPTWNMGRKITIDSATLMNKALEIVEARWLFDAPVEQIEVVVHRQSIVHSMVEFRDGSIIAQMGNPDMKVPIQYALTYPDRVSTRRRYFSVENWSTLTFEKPDRERFPALDLGFRAAREEGLAGTVLNAANEAAVELFLKGAIKFDEITPYVGQIMDKMENKANPTLEEILAADRWAREVTE
jgi:1-deoxy-D-xylulose-5-phosphate reductoisomerase